MRIEVKTIPATHEIVERAVEEEKKAEPKKVTKRKSTKKEE